jgi:hypothetical protein
VTNRHSFFTQNMRVEAVVYSTLRECMTTYYETYSQCQRSKIVYSFHIFTNEANVVSKHELKMNDYFSVITSIKLRQLCS